jgi:hypothetical protein
MSVKRRWKDRDTDDWTMVRNGGVSWRKTAKDDRVKWFWRMNEED